MTKHVVLILNIETDREDMMIRTLHYNYHG